MKILAYLLVIPPTLFFISILFWGIYQVPIVAFFLGAPIMFGAGISLLEKTEAKELEKKWHHEQR